jgi:hypothetical protein
MRFSINKLRVLYANEKGGSQPERLTELTKKKKKKTCMHTIQNNVDDNGQKRLKMVRVNWYCVTVA